MKKGGSGKKVANSLVAMSSAAVLAVYAAGYTRTRTAAQLLETQAEERRPAASRPARTAAVAEIMAVPAPSAPPAAVSLAAESSNKPDKPQLMASAGTAPVKASHPAAVETSKAETPAAPVVESKVEATAPIMTAPPVAPPAVVVAAPAAVAAVAPPAAVAPSWKDGTYYGWGTSRHGDIQAAVMIESGRISSATIAQCLTRYSCSVISRLPPEVAQRQSPDVDYVSGATKSANAFYYAVVDALSKAK